MIPFICTPQSYGDRKQNSGCLLGEGLIGKGHEGTLCSDGNVLYFDRDVDYLGICICQNWSN